MRLGPGLLLAAVVMTGGARVAAAQVPPPSSDPSLMRIDPASATSEQLVYPMVLVDRPVMLPQGLYQAWLDLSSTSLDALSDMDDGISLFDYVNSELGILIGLRKAEMRLSLGYDLVRPDADPSTMFDPDSRSRLTDFDWMMRFRSAKRGGLRMAFGISYPFEDFRVVRIGDDYAMRIKVAPRVAIEWLLGARYQVQFNSGDNAIHLVDVPLHAGADVQILPQVSASAKLRLTIPVFDEPDFDRETAVDFLLRGTYAFTQRMVDVYFELGFIDQPGDPVRALLGAQVRFP